MENAMGAEQMGRRDKILLCDQDDREGRRGMKQGNRSLCYAKYSLCHVERSETSRPILSWKKPQETSRWKGETRSFSAIRMTEGRRGMKQGNRSLCYAKYSLCHVERSETSRPILSWKTPWEPSRWEGETRFFSAIRMTKRVEER